MKALVLSTIAILAVASGAAAFQRETTDDEVCEEAPGINCGHSGTPLSWRTFPVSFFVAPDFAGLSFQTVVDVAERSFQTWETASREGITFRLAGTATQGDTDGSDGRNTVFFRPFPIGQATFAQSVLTFDSETGEIFDVDIELNSNFTFAVLPSGQNDPNDPRVDLEAVLTHEAGHLLGLDHENRFGEAVVMFFSDTTGNTTHRTLTSDDRNGVRAIYPAGTGNGGGDDGGGGGGGCETTTPAAVDRHAVMLLGLGLITASLARRTRLARRRAERRGRA